MFCFTNFKNYTTIGRKLLFLYIKKRNLGLGAYKIPMWKISKLCAVKYLDISIKNRDRKNELKKCIIQENKEFEITVPSSIKKCHRKGIML